MFCTMHGADGNKRMETELAAANEIRERIEAVGEGALKVAEAWARVEERRYAERIGDYITCALCLGGPAVGWRAVARELLAD